MTESDFLSVVCSLLIILVILAILITLIRNSEDNKSEYAQGFARCRICRYQCISVLEFEGEFKNIDMECANCHNMSLEFVTEEEWNRTLTDAILKSYD